MPNVTFGGFAGGATYGVNLQRLLYLAKEVFARIDDTNFLGTDPNQRVAEMVNLAIEELLEDNPALGRTTGNLAMTTAQTTAIPTDLHGVALYRLYYADAGSDANYDNAQLVYIPPREWQLLNADLRNGETTADWPWGWALDKTAENIVWVPAPSTARTVVCEYRKKPTALAAADVASPSLVVIGEIPGRFLRALALHVSVQMTETYQPDKAPSLIQLRDREWAKVSETLTDIVPSMGSQKGLMNRDGMFSNWERSGLKSYAQRRIY